MTWKRTGMYSLGWRLSWLFAVQTLVGLGVLSGAIYVVGVWNLSAKADAELGRKTELVRHLVSEAASSGDLPTMRHKLNEFFFGHDDMQVTLFDPRGAVAYESPGRVTQQGMQRSIRFDLRETVAFSQAGITLDRSGDARLLAGLAALLMTSTFLGTIAVSCWYADHSRHCGVLRSKRGHCKSTGWEIDWHWTAPWRSCSPGSNSSMNFWAGWILRIDSWRPSMRTLLMNCAHPLPL